MKNTIKNINPSSIEPRHEVRSPKKLNRLTRSMRRDGWIGHPLLAIRGGDDMHALTGSHRIAAAIKANLGLIPIYEINVSDLEQTALYDILGARDDDYLLICLEDYIDDQCAIDLMREEYKEQKI